jgi:membrane protease YdiL (CAAX protease family)
VNRTDKRGPGLWARIPVTARAILAGLLIGLGGANVWSILPLVLGGRLTAVAAEVVFLVLYIAWARGLAVPRSTARARADAFRWGPLTGAQWAWGLLAAVAFAATANAALVVLFRLTLFPATEFHRGYDLSFIPTVWARWLVVLVSAVSAGICEETGFRGYMQRPIERRHGPLIAILISTQFFTLAHANKAWLTTGVMPVVLALGLLLGTLAWASRSLVFCIVGHSLMDVGLFAYWWTQIAGVFSEKPIWVTGLDAPFVLAVAALASALTLTLWAIWRLRVLTTAA